MRFLARLRPWHHDDLDARLMQARARAEQARDEARRSRARQAEVREHVITPLREAAERNGFAELIQASLTEGYGGES